MQYIGLKKYFIYISRRYGTKCSGCAQGISPQDMVRKARDKIFHLNCFTCTICRRPLSTGEELYVLDDSKFICKEDYIQAKQGKRESKKERKRKVGEGILSGTDMNESVVEENGIEMSSISLSKND
jgi:hypothetical protein